jgi:hypothetical protein
MRYTCEAGVFDRAEFAPATNISQPNRRVMFGKINNSVVAKTMSPA